MNRKHLRLSLDLGRALGGLALIGGAAGLAAAEAFSDAVPFAVSEGSSFAHVLAWALLLVAPLAGLVSGSALLLTSVTERCAGCARELLVLRARFPDEVCDVVAAGVEPEPERVLELLERLPPPGPGVGMLLEVECAACPGCRRVGRVAASRLVWHEGRTQYEPERRVAFAELEGPVVEGFTRLAERRAAGRATAASACA